MFVCVDQCILVYGVCEGNRVWLWRSCGEGEGGHGCRIPVVLCSSCAIVGADGGWRSPSLGELEADVSPHRSRQPDRATGRVCFHQIKYTSARGISVYRAHLWVLTHNLSVLLIYIVAHGRDTQVTSSSSGDSISNTDSNSSEDQEGAV